MAEGLTRRLLLIGGIGPILSIPKGNRRIVHKLHVYLTYLKVGMDLLPTYLYLYVDHQFVSVTARSKPPLVL